MTETNQRGMPKVTQAHGWSLGIRLLLRRTIKFRCTREGDRHYEQRDSAEATAKNRTASAEATHRYGNAVNNVAITNSPRG